MTRRRWIAENWDEATATLVGSQAEHMARVLRAQPGVEADVVAGGKVFHAVVAAIEDNGPSGVSEVRFNLIAEVEAEPALPVTLVMSIYKFDHMEWAIEKATELGVVAIAPVIARRTEKRLTQAAVKRVERWRRIAHEAAQQSRRSMCHSSTIRFRCRSECSRNRRERDLCLQSRSGQRRCETQWTNQSAQRGKDASAGDSDWT